MSRKISKKITPISEWQSVHGLLIRVFSAGRQAKFRHMCTVKGGICAESCALCRLAEIIPGGGELAHEGEPFSADIAVYGEPGCVAEDAADVVFGDEKPPFKLIERKLVGVAVVYVINDVPYGFVAVVRTDKGTCGIYKVQNLHNAGADDGRTGVSESVGVFFKPHKSVVKT